MELIICVLLIVFFIVEILSQITRLYLIFKDEKRKKILLENFENSVYIDDEKEIENEEETEDDKKI